MAVNIPILLQTNPGLQGMRFSVGYDTVVFSDVTFLGTGNEGVGSIEVQIDKENGNIEFFWENDGEEKKTGKLGTLVFQTKNTVTDGMYPLQYRYVQEDTYDGNWMDVKLDLSGGNIQFGKDDNTGIQQPDDVPSGKPDDTPSQQPDDSTSGKPGSSSG